MSDSFCVPARLYDAAVELGYISEDSTFCGVPCERVERIARPSPLMVSDLHSIGATPVVGEPLWQWSLRSQYERLCRDRGIQT